MERLSSADHYSVISVLPRGAMDRLSRPERQLLASLPLDQRAARYRQFAAQAVIKAREETDPDRRAEFLTMASGWHAMAIEAERHLGKTIPSDAVNRDQPEARPDKSR